MKNQTKNQTRKLPEKLLRRQLRQPKSLLTLILASAMASLNLVVGHSAYASIEATSQVRVYDDGETKVTSPALDIDATFNNDRMKLGAGFTTDILTSSSSDVRTYSTKGVITDERKEFSTNFETAVDDGTLGVGYLQSDEKDYHSKIVTASGTREFFQKNTVFGLGFSNGQDRVQNVSDKSFDEPMNHQVYSLSLSQVLSRLSLIQFIYDFRVESGFIMSPYRQAKIRDGTTITSLPENHPRTRNRNAFAVKYNYFYQPMKITFASIYRFYVDSWEVQSHTLEERITRELGKRWSVSLLLRYYQQKKASFYEDYYTTTPGPFYTGNTTLSTYDSVLVGIRPSFNISDGVSIYAKYEMYKQDFKDASDAGQKTVLSDDKKLKTDAQVIGVGLTAKF